MENFKDRSKQRMSSKEVMRRREALAKKAIAAKDPNRGIPEISDEAKAAMKKTSDQLRDNSK